LSKFSQQILPSSSSSSVTVRALQQQAAMQESGFLLYTSNQCWLAGQVHLVTTSLALANKLPIQRR